jgi:hypothetical protein
LPSIATNWWQLVAIGGDWWQCFNLISSTVLRTHTVTIELAQPNLGQFLVHGAVDKLGWDTLDGSV